MFSCTNIKTQKLTNTTNFISQLEPSEITEIVLDKKMPTDVSLFSGTGESVTIERRIPRKPEYEITCNVIPKKGSSYKSR